MSDVSTTVDWEIAAGIVVLDFDEDAHTYSNEFGLSPIVDSEKKYSEEFLELSPAHQATLIQKQRIYFTEQLKYQIPVGIEMVPHLDIIFFRDSAAAELFVEDTVTSAARRELKEMKITRIAIGIEFYEGCHNGCEHMDENGDRDYTVEDGDCEHTVENGDLDFLPSLLKLFGSIEEVLLVTKEDCSHQASLSTEANEEMARVMAPYEARWISEARAGRKSGRWPSPEVSIILGEEGLWELLGKALVEES